MVHLVQGVYYREYRDLSVVTVGLHLTVLALATSCATLHLHQLTDPVDLLRLDLAAPVASIRRVVTVSSAYNSSEVRLDPDPGLVTGLALAADTGRLLLAAVAETGGVTLVTWESSLARRRRADKGELERQDYIICMFNRNLLSFRHYIDSIGQSLD